MHGDRLRALGAVRLFAPLSRRELARVADASELLTAGAGSEVVTGGERGSDFYLVLDGTATVRRRRRKVATIGPGGRFGELALLDGGARTATVVADTDLQLLRIDQPWFRAVVEDVPAVAGKLLVGLAGRLQQADARAFSH